MLMQVRRPMRVSTHSVSVRFGGCDLTLRVRLSILRHNVKTSRPQKRTTEAFAGRRRLRRLTSTTRTTWYSATLR